jgi:hypothetical protein
LRGVGGALLEALYPENGFYGGVRAGKKVERVKRSCFIVGKIVLKTYGKTWFFLSKMEKNWQMRAQTRTNDAKLNFFEKKLRRKKFAIVGYWAVNANWCLGVGKVSGEKRT